MVRPNLVVEKGENERVDQRFPEIALKDGDCLIGINPGAIYGTAKRWLPERFAEAADQFGQEIPRRLITREKSQLRGGWRSWRGSLGAMHSRIYEGATDCAFRKNDHSGAHEHYTAMFDFFDK